MQQPCTMASFSPKPDLAAAAARRRAVDELGVIAHPGHTQVCTAQHCAQQTQRPPASDASEPQRRRDSCIQNERDEFADSLNRGCEPFVSHMSGSQLG
ncbi:MAG: hypothetical protein QOC63_3854 [Mycobacterium sp.]|jgi:hypothetical protein|nr:hypothetical protein [Mycobacterium sp.]